MQEDITLLKQILLQTQDNYEKLMTKYRDIITNKPSDRLILDRIIDNKNCYVSKIQLYNIIETLNQNIQNKQELVGSRSNNKSVSIGYIQGCLDCINLIKNLLGEENEKEY